MRTITEIFFFSLLLYTLHTHNSAAQLVSDFRLNNDTTNTEQFSAKMGVDSSGIITSVWRDQRNNKPNIYAQRFNSNGILLGLNFRININPDSSGSPAIAVAKNGTFGVCWVEINGTINNSSRVKFRIYNSDAQPLSGEILVNDTNGNFSGPLSIGVNQLNEYTITWEQKNILFQKIDSLGEKIGNNKKVNDDTGDNTHKNPSITTRLNGSFIITWSDTRPPSTHNVDDIYMQVYDGFGNKIGMNQKVNDDLSSLNLQQTPKISSDTLNSFVISWTDNRNDIDYTEIYAQMYINNGIKHGINFKVTQSSIFYPKGICNVVKRPNGEFLVAWGEFRPSIPLPYFQRYTNSGIRIGNDFLVTSEYQSINKYYSDVKIFKDRIISVWTDARNGPFDIYCNIRSFTNPDTIVNIIQTSTHIPEKFTLYQNYPNPFNGQTIMEFDIVDKGVYSLNIYNLLGQKIEEIFNEYKNSGSYRVNYNSLSISSGMYVYSLSNRNEKLLRYFVILR